MPGDFVLVSRGSALARRQTDEVVAGLRRAWPELSPRCEIVRTTGDGRPEAPLVSLGGAGVFTKELERRLLDGCARAAVHSLKDLPVVLPDGLAFGAVLRRADPRDVLVSTVPGGVDALPSGARVGTGSPRRKAMLRAVRGDADVVAVRGNVPTRLSLVAQGRVDAVILAAAGLARLDLPAPGTMDIDGVSLHAAALETFLPAPGQGAIAVEIRSDDREAAEWLARLNDEETAAAVRAERAVLRAMGGGCHLPLGALGIVRGGALHLEAVIFDGRGGAPKTARTEGSPEEAEELGELLAAKLYGR